MANTSTRGTLRTRVRQLADNTASTFVTDAEINGWLDLGLSELHDILATKFEDYFESSDSITTVSGTSDYNLASDFYKMLSVDRVAGGIRYTIPRYMNTERNRRQAISAFYPFYGYEYRVIGAKIRFIPTPGAADSIEYAYIPQYVPLAADGTLVSSAIPQGWEELAVIEAAVRCLVKEESDPTFLQIKKQEIIQRIEASASDRDANCPARVADVGNRFARDIDPMYWGPQW